MSEESPEPFERGRYAAYQGEPSGLVIARTTNLCESCSTCGCGTAEETLELTPGGVAKLLRGRKLQAMAKMVMPGGAR